jgi:hypothetical protein
MQTNLQTAYLSLNTYKLWSKVLCHMLLLLLICGCGGGCGLYLQLWSLTILASAFLPRMKVGIHAHMEGFLQDDSEDEGDCQCRGSGVLTFTVF